MFELLQASPLSGSVEALAGYVAYESEEETFSATTPCPCPCPPEAAFVGSGATLGGGLRVGYRCSSQWTIGLRGTVHHFPGAGGGPTGVGQYNGATTIPLQFNVRFRP